METVIVPAIDPAAATGFRDVVLNSMREEMKATVRVLAAVPENRKDYKPDPKATSAGELAWHIVSAEVQFLEEIVEGKFSMEPRYQPPTTIAEIIKWYEQHFAGAAAKVQGMTGEQLAKPINFYGLFNFPAYQYLLFANNHSVHHRGQLAAYLRPMGSKVPSIYGGSADEPFQM